MFEALRLSNNTTVAFKISRSEEFYRKAAQNEISILLDLSTKKITPRLIDHFTHKNHVVIVSEYFEGTLSEAIKSNFGFSLAFIKKAGRVLVELILKVHNAGYIHCDIKPDNIMFADRNDVTSMRLIDFGTAVKINQAESKFGSYL